MHGKLAVGGPSIASPVIQCTQQENQTFAMSSVHWLIKICAVLPWTVTVNSFQVDCVVVFSKQRGTRRCIVTDCCRGPITPVSTSIQFL